MVRKILLFCGLLIILFSSNGYPAGFLVYNQDAASSGMSNAFAAIADNASAIFYNPAGINQLEGLDQPPIEAYVVSGNVTSAQSLDRNRIENATI